MVKKWEVVAGEITTDPAAWFSGEERSRKERRGRKKERNLREKEMEAESSSMYSE